MGFPAVRPMCLAVEGIHNHHDLPQVANRCLVASTVLRDQCLPDRVKLAVPSPGGVFVLEDDTAKLYLRLHAVWRTGHAIEHFNRFEGAEKEKLILIWLKHNRDINLGDPIFAVLPAAEGLKHIVEDSATMCLRAHNAEIATMVRQSTSAIRAV